MILKAEQIDMLRTFCDLNVSCVVQRLAKVNICETLTMQLYSILLSQCCSIKFQGTDAKLFYLM